MTRATTSSGTRMPGAARLARGLVAAAIVAGVTAASLLFGPASSAQAHAYVVATTPENGAELDQAPTEIRVTFDEPVTLGDTDQAAAVVDAEGDRVDDGTPALDEARTTLTITLRGGLAEGVYIASWSVVSADTHPVGGSIQFGYGVPASAAGTASAPEPSASLTLAVGVAKGLLYLALVLAFGLVPAARVLGADERERRGVVRLARVGAALAIAASAAQLVLQFLWLASAGSADATWSSFWSFARSSYGLAIGIRVLVLAVALVVVRARPGRTRLTAVIALGLAAVVTAVVNGHGGAGSWLVFVSTTLHAAAAIAWIGGLLLLGWALLRRRLSADRLGRMPYWSLYAGAAVAVLAASGLLQAIVEVGYPEALTSTTYGAILLAKLALVVVAIVLGAFGYGWARRQLREADEGRPVPGATARLRARVRWEAGIGVAVIVISGVLSSVTPAKDDYAPTATGEAAAGPYQLTLEVGPARLGPESFRVVVAPASDDTAQPQQVLVTLSQEDGPLQDVEVELSYRIPGAVSPGEPTSVTFVSGAVNVPATGEWVASITVVASDIEQYSTVIRYEVR